MIGWTRWLVVWFSRPFLCCDWTSTWCHLERSYRMLAVHMVQISVAFSTLLTKLFPFILSTDEDANFHRWWWCGCVSKKGMTSSPFLYSPIRPLSPLFIMCRKKGNSPFCLNNFPKWRCNFEVQISIEISRLVWGKKHHRIPHRLIVLETRNHRNHSWMCRWSTAKERRHLPSSSIFSMKRWCDSTTRACSETCNPTIRCDTSTRAGLAPDTWKRFNAATLRLTLDSC